MTDPQIIYASAQTESANDVLERIGVETIRKEGCKPLWKYQDKVYPRPDYVNAFEDKMLEYFNIKIVWRDENQLTMF